MGRKQSSTQGHRQESAESRAAGERRTTRQPHRFSVVELDPAPDAAAASRRSLWMLLLWGKGRIRFRRIRKRVGSYTAPTHLAQIDMVTQTIKLHNIDRRWPRTFSESNCCGSPLGNNIEQNNGIDTLVSTYTRWHYLLE